MEKYILVQSHKVFIEQDSVPQSLKVANYVLTQPQSSN